MSSPLNRNVDIKVRIDDLEPLRARLPALAKGPEVLRQEDWFFRVPRGRLKLRKLRDDLGQLMYYERPLEEGETVCSWVATETSEPNALRATLAASIGETGCVKKVRTVFLDGTTRIHLDEVERLGSFLEIEVILRAGQTVEDGRRELWQLFEKLEVGPHEKVAASYVDLLDALERSR